MCFAKLGPIFSVALPVGHAKHSPLSGVVGSAPGQCSYAQQKLPKLKGLIQVIVGPDSEAAFHVQKAVEGREYYHRLPRRVILQAQLLPRT